MHLAFQTYSPKFPYFAECKSPYFLTGRALIGDGQSTASATENKPPLEMAKTCLVHLPEERVKRWGKSPPPPQ